MILQIQKQMKKAAIILIALTIIVSLNIAPLEAGGCERAFSNCMLEAAVYMPFFSRGYIDMAYCLNGWIFCRKYIEN